MVKNILKYLSLAVFCFFGCLLMFNIIKDGYIPLGSFIGACIIFVVMVFLKKSLTPWRWLSVDGVNGYRITGPNGNKIFMPAIYYIHGYWTSTLHESGSNKALNCFFTESNYKIESSVRYTSCAVRPVKE